MPWGMLYTVHLAQGHFQDPPEADLGRDQAPHGGLLPCTNLNDIKQWAEEECKTYISLLQFISALETVCLSLSFVFLFISVLSQVFGFLARCKANWVSVRDDLLSRFLRNRQTCVWNLHIWVLYRWGGIHVSLHAYTHTHTHTFIIFLHGVWR